MKTLLLILVSLTVFPFPTKTHSEGIKLLTQNRKTPIEIGAKDGIEWSQKEQVYIARGNAFARQGTTTIYGDKLSAWYTKRSNGSTQIFRIDAIGNVRILSPQQTAQGTRGVYIINQGLMILTGAPKLFSGSDEITAQDSLEFWDKKNLAIARGAAKISRGENLLRADILTARLARDEKQETRINSIEARNNVLISTGKEIIKAERGTYDLKTEIVRIERNVRITRGENQLNGDRGVVNFKTGVSQIFSDSGNQARGFLRPTKETYEPKLGR